MWSQVAWSALCGYVVSCSSAFIASPAWKEPSLRVSLRKGMYIHTKYWKPIWIGSAWQSHTWLDCDTELSSRKNIVMKLRYCVCAKFKTRIATRRNASEQWLCGAESLRTSNIRDHARADQHIYAMPVTAYIAAVGANMHTHDTVKCIYTRPACHPCMCNERHWSAKPSAHHCMWLYLCAD